MTSAPEPADAAATDPKERFRQALEAKKQRGGHSGHHADGTKGGGKGSSAAAGGKREFRRKSG